VPLIDRAALEGFQCGEQEIDRKITQSCDSQNTHRVRIFVALIEGVPRAYGFYSLSISAAETKYLDDKIFQEHQDRAFLPFLYLNHIAVVKEWQGGGLGTGLLINALGRCELVARNVGLYGVALHALSDRVAGLYDRYGFRAVGREKHPFMVLPVQSLFDLFESAKSV
jgi:GNAT superfamily N-acetyltransferase